GGVGGGVGGGGGVVVGVGEVGSWEVFGGAMAQWVPLNAVVRPLRGGLNAQLVDARRRAGLGLIPPRGALLGTVAALRRNEVVAMLIDQAIGGEDAPLLPLFRRPAAATPPPAMGPGRPRGPPPAGGGRPGGGGARPAG